MPTALTRVTRSTDPPSTQTTVANRVDTAIGEAEDVIDALDARVVDVELERLLYVVADIGHADFTAAALTQTLALPALHATLNAFLVHAWLEKVTDFSGGAVSAFTLQVGHDTPTADPNAYVVATNVFTGAGAGNVGFTAATCGVDQVAATFQPILPATRKITVLGTAVDANVVALTAGAAKVHALYRLLA